MKIGVPKEILRGERRVSVTPDTTEKFIKDGFTVQIESGAGQGALFTDAQYAAKGAVIVTDPVEVYAQADIILKVKEPQFNSAKQMHEVDMMHAGQYLITFLHPASPANHDMIKSLAAKGVISLTLDGVPRITRAQNMDALTTMSTCAGYKGMLMAADSLTKFVPQIFCAIGSIKPCNVLVIGAGVSGLQAIATAKRLGAIVYAADVRPNAAEEAKSLGAKLFETGVAPEIAVGEGGYAASLPEDVLAKEREALKAVLPQMDIVFLSALVPGKTAPLLLTEEMVGMMTPGSVVVDISIDQGGNCNITTPGEIDVKHGVTIIGVKNIPGLIPTSSTWMFSNNVYNLLKYLSADGQLSLNTEDEIVSSILTTIDGKIVHSGAREAIGL